MKLLITLGCSWTAGVGVNYNESMSDADYKKTAWDVSFTDQYSFRGLMSKKYGFKNLNFSSGGSSNQRQFRKAKTFFTSDFFKQLKDSADEIIVLWGITSTARTEYFSLDKNQIVNDFLNKKSDYSKFMISNCYNHDHEIFLLASDMLYWNEYFNLLEIKNYWFDTFNHHDYNVNNPGLANLEQNYNEVSGVDWPSWNDYTSRNFDPMSSIGLEVTDSLRFEFAEYIRIKSIENFVIKDHHRDLASQLAKNFKFDGDLGQYHYSDWKVDSDKIKFLTKLKLLNPYTFHPTKLAHELIAEMFTHIFERDKT
jgi:hypothetical protein